MILPFSIEQFFGVFAAYNSAIWPAQIAAYGLGLAAVATLWQEAAQAPRFILWVLALMWLLNGIGYHLLHFSAINPVANIFAAIFIMQAILLARWALMPQSLTFRVGRDFRSMAGLAFIIYALFIYAAVGFWSGHGFMAGPMFGVAPCPTTIFTIGLLLLARRRSIFALSIIPFLWSLIGIAAALQLGMYEDLALPLAGIVLMTGIAAEAWRSRRTTDRLIPSSGPLAP